MKIPKTFAKACQVLRHRVRYKSAGLRLPTSSFPDDDTEVIREATSNYVEHWIVPLINALERGDLQFIKNYVMTDRGDLMSEDKEGAEE